MIARPFIFARAADTASPRASGARSTRRRHRRAGFTLVEVLATLLLVAIVLPAIMDGIKLATAAGSVARRRTEAATLCQSKLDELVATGEWQTSNLSGDFGADYPDYRWTALAQNWPQQQGVEELDVTVTWTARSMPQSMVLSTLIYPGANGTGTTSSSSTGTGTGSTGTGSTGTGSTGTPR